MVGALENHYLRIDLNIFGKAEAGLAIFYENGGGMTTSGEIWDISIIFGKDGIGIMVRGEMGLL